MMKTRNNKRGVLLFAFNNEEIDYIQLAKTCTAYIHKYWDLPVALVSDVSSIDFNAELINVPNTAEKNVRFYYDFNKALPFYNSNRVSALSVTPFEETIVLDTDFLPQSDLVPRLWDGHDLKLSKRAYSILGRFNTDTQEAGSLGPDMFWATILCFNKTSPIVKAFFEYWRHALEQYRAYSKLSMVSSPLIRNDFAATFALQRLCRSFGTTVPFELPYDIPTLTLESKICWLNPLMITREGDISEWNHDVHVMHKSSLLKYAKEAQLWDYAYD